MCVSVSLSMSDSICLSVCVFVYQVREAAYRIFLYPDPHQEELLSAMLSARHQLANLVGFDTYSHRANRGTMMESPGVDFILH